MNHDTVEPDPLVPAAGTAQPPVPFAAREPAPGECDDCKSASRRALLMRASKAALVALSSPVWMPRIAYSRSSGGGNQDIVVNIFMRGAMDGLSLVAPYGDPDLYNLRPTLAVPPPGSGPNSAIDLDGFFGLAPGAGGLKTPYDNGHLAIVHASGSGDLSRSHFDAMALMEFGTPLQPYGTVSDGWLGRHLVNVPPLGSGPLRGLAVDFTTPLAMQGGPQVISAYDPANFPFPGDPQSAGRRRKKLENMYGGVPDPLQAAALNGLACIDLMKTIDFANYQPENGAVYPATYFGDSLKKIAATIKADTGIETYEIDIHGWDTHVDQGALDGYMNGLMQELCNSIEAFYLDLATWMDRIVLVAMSEFGRRAYENASAGTDHGHGNCMLVMGGHIDGGKVLTNWPTLAPGALQDGQDLAITIDYRDILAEILNVRCGDNSLDLVFPNYTPTFQGITK